MDKQQIPKEQKTVLTGVAVLAAASVAGLAVVASVASQQTQFNSPVQASVVNLSGETVCLSSSSDKVTVPEPKDCVYGLKVTNDVSYALSNLDTGYDKPLRTGDQVTVTGSLAPPPENSAYDAAGVIQVDDIKMQEG